MLGCVAINKIMTLADSRSVPMHSKSDVGRSGIVFGK